MNKTIITTTSNKYLNKHPFTISFGKQSIFQAIKLKWVHECWSIRHNNNNHIFLHIYIYTSITNKNVKVYTHTLSHTNIFERRRSVKIPKTNISMNLPIYVCMYIRAKEIETEISQLRNRKCSCKNCKLLQFIEPKSNAVRISPNMI